MADILISDLCDAIESTLSAASTLTRTQSYNELTETITAGDMPLLQVWPARGEPVSAGGGTTDRYTFGGKGADEDTPRRIKTITINADYYARFRSYLKEDIEAVVNGIDAMITVLETVNVKPYFSQAGIQAFQWSWEYATFPTNDQQRPAAGARFTIVLTLY